MSSKQNQIWAGGLSLLFGLAIAAPVYSQEAESPQTAQASIASSAIADSSPLSEAVVLSYVQQQATLTQQRMALVANGATSLQLQAWYQQNAGVFASQELEAEIMAATSAVQPGLIVQQPEVPDNASATMKAFLTAQTSLSNAAAQIHNQLVQAMPSTASIDQIVQMQQIAQQTFQQQCAADLSLQVQRGQIIANESVQTPLPIPSALHIFSSENSQAASYHTGLYQLMTSRAQVWNQYVNANPNVRMAAMQVWWQQNSLLIQQLQQQGQSLAQAGTSHQN